MKFLSLITLYENENPQSRFVITGIAFQLETESFFYNYDIHFSSQSRIFFV